MAKKQKQLIWFLCLGGKFKPILSAKSMESLSEFVLLADSGRKYQSVQGINSLRVTPHFSGCAPYEYTWF